LNCIKCNKETNNQKFCSRSCSNSFNNQIPKRKRKRYFCIDCDTIIKDRNIRCEVCSTPKDHTLGEAIYTKHHKSSAFNLVRCRARSAVKHLPQVCSKCGYDKHVEVCHIKPIHKFPMTAKLSEINHLDNLKLLCPNCHWEFDHLSKRS